MIYSEITPDVIELLLSGGIMVMPTDTIYGLVGLASNQNTVERIYQIKNRPTDKPCIILIPNLTSLEEFGIDLTPQLLEVINKYWPGPTSLALPIEPHNFSFLHRGTNRIAFRLPSDKKIIDCLEQTGPLMATSANPSGKTPATTVQEAKMYFGNRVDGYIDGGTITALPSSLFIVQKDGTTTLVRP